MDLSSSLSGSSSKENRNTVNIKKIMSENDKELLKMLREDGIYRDLTSNDRFMCLYCFFTCNGPVSSQGIKKATLYTKNKKEKALLNNLDKESMKVRYQHEQRYVSLSPKKKDRKQQDKINESRHSVIWKRQSLFIKRKSTSISSFF